MSKKEKNSREKAPGACNPEPNDLKPPPEPTPSPPPKEEPKPEK
jgi:hypothetical protein